MKNYSKQRRVILDILKKSKAHPTADQVFEMAKGQLPKISRGTVYRNLCEMAEEGLIKRLSLESGAIRYDYMHHAHFHAICKKCNKVLDFDYKLEYNSLREMLSDNFNFATSEQELVLYGICAECNKNN